MSTQVASSLEHGCPVVPWKSGSEAVRQLVPALSYGKHKGQAGRLGVIGGSLEYTGAPFYAASTTLQVGADLAFVFAAEEAAAAIKCYSPELIVVPSYRSADSSEEEVQTALVQTVRPWFDRVHGLVVGPGLGRREGVLKGMAELLEVAARELKLPVVVDADGLFLIAQRPDLVAGCTNVILTPNAVEYDRIKDKVLGKNRSDNEPGAVRDAKELMELCRALGGLTIIKKGRRDLISDGDTVLAVDEVTSPRRCGGLGDVLSGAAGTFLVWASFLKKDHLIGDTIQATPTVWAAYAACVLARRAANAAFQEKRRAMLAPDVLNKVGDTFESMCPTVILDDCHNT